MFDWRSPHHLATAGLQAWDFERGGLAEADLIVATGIDEREAIADWRLAPVVEVPVTELPALAGLIQPRDREIVVPPLRAELAAITQAGWEQTAAPLPPTKVTQHYGQVLGDGGLVAADPGTAGYWVARTFATQQLGGAQVTADRDARRASPVACCTVARLADPAARCWPSWTPSTSAPRSRSRPPTASESTVPVEVWSEVGDALDADAHRSRLHEPVRDRRSGDDRDRPDAARRDARRRRPHRRLDPLDATRCLRRGGRRRRRRR